MARARTNTNNPPRKMRPLPDKKPGSAPNRKAPVKKKTRQPFTKKNLTKAAINAAYALDANMAIHPLIADALRLPYELRNGPAMNMWNTAVKIHNRITPTITVQEHANARFNKHMLKRINMKGASARAASVPKGSPRAKAAANRRGR